MNVTTHLTTIATIGADALIDGMVLAEDLHHFNGRLILKKSTQLGPRELRIIRMWGITEARIQKSLPPGEALSPEEKTTSSDEKAEAAAKELFRFADLEQELNRELYRLFLTRFTTKEAKEPSPSSLLSPPGAGKGAKAVKPVDAREKLKEDIKLPSLPDIVVRINEAVTNPNCTATHIANIINKDSSLTARLLKLVNSAFYNFPTTIESIPRAVTIIGTRQLSAIAMATAVTSTFRDIPPDIIDMKSFWKHSLACGIICRLIAGYKRNGNLDTESYFLAGLLHDIGRLIMYQYFSREAKDILDRARSESRLLFQVEPELLLLRHSELGSILIEQWKLPPLLYCSCLYHHDPLESPDKMVSSITHAADIIANALQMGSSGERYVPPLDPGAWQQIGLPVSVIAPIVQQTDGILRETVHTYLDHADHEKASPERE